jgi:hypothetical protein
MKPIVRALLFGFKSLITALCGIKANLKSSGDINLQSIGNALLTKEEDRQVIIKMFSVGYVSCNIFSHQIEDIESRMVDNHEMQDNLDQLTSIMSLLDKPVAKEVFTTILPHLFDLSINQNMFASVFMRLVSIDSHTIAMTDSLLSYLQYRLPDLGKTVVGFTHESDLLFHVHRNIGLEKAKLSAINRKDHPNESQDKVCSMLLKYFKFAITYSKNHENEKLLRPRIVPLILNCLQLAHISPLATNYYSLIRMMFRVVTTIKYELCYAAINPAIGVILNGLIQLYRSSPNPYIPARWLALTPHMPLLLPYITLALHSATDLPSLAIRTLEYWLDSSNPHDFCTVIQKIPNAAQELIVGLNIHLRPQPHPYGTAALKLLGYTCSL